MCSRPAEWNWGWNAVAGADAGKLYLEAQLIRVNQGDSGDLKLGSFNVTLGIRF